MFIEEQSRLEFYIVIINGASKKEFLVGVERTSLVTTSCLGECLGCLLASYFMFDIAYPRQHYPFLLFVQHAVCNLKDQIGIQYVPVSNWTMAKEGFQCV